MYTPATKHTHSVPPHPPPTCAHTVPWLPGPLMEEQDHVEAHDRAPSLVCRGWTRLGVQCLPCSTSLHCAATRHFLPIAGSCLGSLCSAWTLAVATAAGYEAAGSLREAPYGYGSKADGAQKAPHSAHSQPGPTSIHRGWNSAMGLDAVLPQPAVPS